MPPNIHLNSLIHLPSQPSSPNPLMSNPQTLLTLATNLVTLSQQLSDMSAQLSSTASSLEEEAANLAEERARQNDVDISIAVGVRTGGVAVRHPQCAACEEHGGGAGTGMAGRPVAQTEHGVQGGKGQVAAAAAAAVGEGAEIRVKGGGWGDGE
ncbi:hypothetical protein BS50DRAFT_568000 [Corynespora cassiicola Philippines]|uniref:Uncharacterized protein n=1 Tax=Corynespora cassiicola Philippines TaxID=1448308 RepID=A0A2T2PCB8_CORCC|nr:hypothetical protein BS50DRAFT_568000 [Corynespora cassiicola Philippines]